MPQTLLRLAFILSFSLTSAALLHLAFASPASFQLSSNSFSPNESIPQKFTCQGQDISPQLSWTGSPITTQSFALIMDDPDAPAGTWLHWMLYNLPATTRELAENVPSRQELPNDARQGLNDFHKIGYGGPCPPAGQPHRYFFKLYALDVKLRLRSGFIKADLERAMQTHIVGQAQLIGLYGR